MTPRLAYRRRSPTRRPRRTSGNRGVAALEFALVVPVFIVMICGVFTFTFAFLGRHLLSNMAAETARSCVLRTIDGESGVTSCVTRLGPWLATAGGPDACMGQPVLWQAEVVRGLNPGFAASLTSNTDERMLKVTASCTYTFLPGFNGILPGGSISSLSSLKGVAMMPYLVPMGT